MERITKPFEYQKKSITTASNLLLHDGFVAWFVEMGLGKSLMSLYTACNFYDRQKLNKVVIVCPKALVSTWETQIKEHLGLEKNIFKWQGSQKACSKKFLYEFERFLKLDIGFFVVNIEAFQARTRNKFIEDELIGSFDFEQSMILIDESSKIKSPTAYRTKHLIALASLFKYRMILTGTEITNTVLDIYTQMEFLKNNFWGAKNFFTFRARYAVLEDEYAAGGRTFKKVVGFQRVTELMSRTQPHIIRLKKKDCLDLPEKIFQIITLDMPAEMRRVYEQLKDDLYAEYKNKELTVTTKIALFTRFRQICGGFFPQADAPNHYIDENPKLEYILEESEDTDKKAIIWCSFVNEISQIAKDIGGEKYCGEVGNDAREEAIERFRNYSRFLVINPQTGAYGLNLQFCDLVYYYTLPLSPEQYWQSQDRCHRIGQKNNVQYKILLYKDSIDERIYKLNELKTDTANKFAAMTLDDVFDFI